MPSPMVQKASTICEIPIEKVEELWKKAEDISAKQYKNTSDYRLITSIFKHSLGKECNSKLGWNTQWNRNPITENILSLIHEIEEFDSESAELCNSIMKQINKKNLRGFILINNPKTNNGASSTSAFNRQDLNDPITNARLAHEKWEIENGFNPNHRRSII